MAFFCVIDPGFQGGISIITENDSENPIIYRMPVIKITKMVKGKKRIKQFYDLLEIRKIFKKYLNKKSILMVEKVAPHVGEGSVSSFSFGRGYGNLEGIIVGLFEKPPIEVSSQTWKKYFPELITDEMRKIKIEMKELRIIDKTLKEKGAKNANKKQIDKLGRQFKSLAKTEARELVSKLYPSISDKFIKKNSDGMAESLLIALYGRNYELV